ncbi:hypothetical protein BD779DRAFT_1608372 [Infundibulicybe gibba]|nr:hypothetical protein BD779DRAFT_1608372 [Infundibulicybe gibba]
MSFLISKILAIPPSLAVLLFFLVLPSTLADPATVPFTDCFSNANVTQKFNISTVYAQVLQDVDLGTYLNLTVVGESPQEIIGVTNASSSLATLFTSTSVLTLNAWTNSSYLCSTLRPPSSLSDNITHCPIPAGPFAFSSSVPWGSNRALTTLNTRLRAVDPFSDELLCIDVATTPLDPNSDRPYGRAQIILWATVGLTIAMGRGITRPERSIWSRAQSAGFILASAISGERLATSPALMRFCTPSMRDLIFHTQWCAALAMVAVEWPSFIYPLLTQTAWSTLTYSPIHIVPLGSLTTLPFNPSSDFAEQFSNASSPLFINNTVPNILFMLPGNATSGISSFAYTVGLRPEDLFGVCLILFLGIIATASSSLPSYGSASSSHQGPRLGGTRSPAFGSTNKELSPDPPLSAEENKSLNGRDALGPSIFRPSAWWRVRSDISSFHGSVLHGNLVRILVLFHLPITIFSRAPLSSIVLAALSFHHFWCPHPHTSCHPRHFHYDHKLYDETRTLLSLGPLYNHYRHGSQLFASLLFATNLAFGITIGAGQKSGTAQAIVILVVEVVSALFTSIWLPWGSGASMGLISFLFCVARIVIAVLLVILTPAISIGSGAGGWVAYGILIILALVYLALALMLVVKLFEALVRIMGGIGFDRSRHVVDSGLLGACGLLGCCGPRNRHRRRRDRNPHHKYKPAATPPQPAHRDSDGSTHSGPPPSVLRPEHAMRPYREESDDENGFIMGAWQPFPRGYTPGGGGKAHIDTPYAITSGSTLTFPSIGQQSAVAVSAPTPPFFDDDDDSPPPSLSNVARHHDMGGLPPGAMQPAHIRTKSQTAIIEDTSSLGSPQAGPSDSRTRRASSGGLLHPPVAWHNSMPDDESEDTTPRKKPWYHLRRNRPHSIEGTPAPTLTLPVDVEAAAEVTPSQPGRSFVVVRKARPSHGRADQNNGDSSREAASGSQPDRNAVS